jgi:citrate lyase beta subunit
MKSIKHIRSLLYVPGNSKKMLEKIPLITKENSPDVFVCDLEDSV